MDGQTPRPASPLMIAGATTSVLANVLYAFSAFGLALREPQESEDKGELLFIAIMITAGISLLLWLITSMLVCCGSKYTGNKWDTPTKIFASQLLAMLVIGGITVAITANRDFHPHTTDEEKKEYGNSMARGLSIMFICLFNSVVLFFNGISLCVARCRCCHDQNDDDEHELHPSRDHHILDVDGTNSSTGSFDLFKAKINNHGN
eukprot:TRINITY_DN14369_c0_g1_i1.p1 TRINITY_DN14369_c0_g1~~TRINITY_DN14369_c0_g1_i1.p1  ORF type:complete len:205 (+),score=22.30 TRINITY_DN14369_c0_g1_i1:53-667(+)